MDGWMEERKNGRMEVILYKAAMRRSLRAHQQEMAGWQIVGVSCLSLTGGPVAIASKDYDHRPHKSGCVAFPA
eukprot:scaffold647887_cov42-Prasinocladus_malaysianus.AAC.3